MKDLTNDEINSIINKYNTRANFINEIIAKLPSSMSKWAQMLNALGIATANQDHTDGIILGMAIMQAYIDKK